MPSELLDSKQNLLSEELYYTLHKYASELSNFHFQMLIIDLASTILSRIEVLDRETQNDYISKALALKANTVRLETKKSIVIQ